MNTQEIEQLISQQRIDLLKRDYTNYTDDEVRDFVRNEFLQENDITDSVEDFDSSVDYDIICELRAEVCFDLIHEINEAKAEGE